MGTRYSDLTFTGASGVRTLANDFYLIHQQLQRLGCVIEARFTLNTDANYPQIAETERLSRHLSVAWQGNVSKSEPPLISCME